MFFNHYSSGILNLMFFFLHIYLSTGNVHPIINQTMKLKDGKILICCHGKEKGCSLDLKRGDREAAGGWKENAEEEEEDGREHYHRSFVVEKDEKGDSRDETFRGGERIREPFVATVVFAAYNHHHDG